MLYTFLGLIALLVAAIALIFSQADKSSYEQSDLINLFAALFLVISGVGLLLFVFFVGGYVSAGYKAELINKEYGTHYTQAEVFYGSDVIDKIQQVKRQRIEINGNLLKDDGNK